jgi:signal peptidase II
MFRRRSFAFVPALVLLVIDRVFKIFFLTNPAVRIGGDFLFNLVTLHFESNAGIAFGVMVPRIFLLLLSAIIIILVISFSVRSHSAMVSGIGMLIAAGAASNFFDRIRYGAVIDYIDVRWFTVLNIADIMISVGAALLVLVLWRDDKKMIQLDTSKKIS